MALRFVLALLLPSGSALAATPALWATADFSGASPAKISASATRNSARVTIANDHRPETAETWHLALFSEVPVTEGRHYEGSFTIRASEEVTFEILLQKTGEPFTTFVSQKVMAGPNPVTLYFDGTANFSSTKNDPSSMARILFPLGKLPAGTTLTLENTSFRELPEVATTARATVDFSRPLPVPSLSGFLLGLDVNNLADGQPGDHLVKPLRPKFWRVRSEWADRVTALGATPIVLCSEGKYPPATPPWADDYEAWRAHVTTLAQRHGTAAIYDIWNEPDMGMFFLDWPDADFAKFLETFKQAHDAIRAVVPDAVISGPSLSASYPAYRLREFMEFCKANHLKVQVLALHMLDREDAGLARMKFELAQIRADFIDNPQFAAVGAREIHINEYGAPGDPSYRPGSILAFLRAMEEAGVVAACRSCWDHPDAPGVNSGFDGSLDGLLTHDTHQPRAVWWAYQWYAKSEGRRVATTSNNPDLIVIASQSAPESESPAEAQVLLASNAASGAPRPLKDVSVQFQNLGALSMVTADAKQLRAKIERIGFAAPGTAAVPEPEILTESLPVAVVRGTATISALILNPHDVLRITISSP